MRHYYTANGNGQPSGGEPQNYSGQLLGSWHVFLLQPRTDRRGGADLEPHKPEFCAALLAVVADTLATIQSEGRHYRRDERAAGTGYVRLGQDTFGPATIPFLVDQIGRGLNVSELASTGTLQAVRDSIVSDPTLSSRFDNMVGNAYGGSRFSLEMFLDSFVTQVLIGPSESGPGYVHELYRIAEEEILSDVIAQVFYIPIIGLKWAGHRLDLGNGLVLRQMTDAEISQALSSVSIPSYPIFQNILQVSTEDQWALTMQVDLPTQTGDERTPLPTEPNMVEFADRLVCALRLIGGGSITATRPINMVKAGVYLPSKHGASTVLRSFSPVDIGRRCHIFDIKENEIIELFEKLAPGRLERSHLSVAARRFRDAGLRQNAEDRLIDLMIAVESICGDGDTQAIRYKTAMRMAIICSELEYDEHTPATIRKFVECCYDARSTIVHGGKRTREQRRAPSYPRLAGEASSSLEPLVADFERLVAIVLRAVVTPDDPFNGIADWNAQLDKRL